MIKKKQIKIKHWIGAFLFVCALLSACSTSKNTSGTRFYHATTARFNTFYNGKVAFDKGIEQQYKGHKENYTTLLPMFISTAKETQSIGKVSFNVAIEKCEKAIKVHSIKKRPTLKTNKRLTPKEREYRNRKEFNPFLYKAWLLMAESQFQKGEFIECASTCNYIIRLYQTQPEIANVARAWLAKCYVALEWPYDAEDVLSKMSRDSLTTRALQEKEKSHAALLIETGQYQKAIPYLEQAVEHTRLKPARNRLLFLLGQLYQEVGEKGKAYKTYARVIRSNPPYEMSFNARIKQAEAVTQNQTKKILSKLRRMDKSDKNQAYRDQIYEAMGNIYMADKDTLRAIGAYEKGVEVSAGNKFAKSVLLLKLCDIYWTQEKYIDAARTYEACTQVLDKEHTLYNEVQHRSEVLKGIAPHLSTIHLQDSLQLLAKMDEAQRNAAIDRVIEALKKKEKEEQKKRDALEAANRPTSQDATNKPTPLPNNANNKGDWYFYNPSSIEAGKKDFQRKWGKRANEDNWQFSSKEGLFNITASTHEELEANTELLATEDSIQEVEEIEDSLVNDPHHRAYYMAQIPFTPEQLEQSNQEIEKALYEGGLLVQERLGNLQMAHRMYERLLKDFPETENRDNVYYHLFLLYGKKGQEEATSYYQKVLTDSFPDSKYTIRINNPNYLLIAQQGAHIEDSIYASSYQAYMANDYAQVENNYVWYTKNLEVGKHHARMLFVRAMSNLYAGNRDTFMVALKEVVQKYPKEEVSELANAIVKGLDQGRALMNKQTDTRDIWSRHTRSEEGDSLQSTPSLKEDRLGNFAFVLAYPTGEVNEHQLVFEMARYNFTQFMVRNFDMETIEQQGLTYLVVKGFQSYDEVHAYAQILYSDTHMVQALQGIRSLLILEENLRLLGTSYSFEEYEQFYEEKLAPIEMPEEMELDEPTHLEILEEEESPEVLEGNEEEIVEDDFPFGF